MSLVSLEVEIDDGHVTAKEPDLLPKHGRGILTVLPSESPSDEPAASGRVELPLIPPTGHVIDPTKDDLDASLWDKSS